MQIDRRKLIGGGAAAMAAGITSACATRPMGSTHSYASHYMKPRNYTDNVVAYWADVMLQQTRDQRVAPPRAAYNFAMPTVAGFLAANAIVGKYSENFGIGPAPADLDPELAYGVAFATCASEVFKQPFVAERAAFKKRFADGDRKSRSIKWGRLVGLRILKMRTNDGSQPSKVNHYRGDYKRRKDALKWTPVGTFYSEKPGPAFPSFDRGLFPGHGLIKPWSMQHRQFPARPFIDPASPEFAEQYDMVRRLGGKDSKERTKDQAFFSLYWEDGPWGVTPPGRFMLIALQVMQDRGLSFIDWARAVALLGATQCDASINAWDNKYMHDVIRPETAIRHRTAKFGNRDARVTGQRNWQSLIPTPPFPAYTSGHSTFGAAGARIIGHVMGTDKIAFSQENPDQVIWPQLRGVSRSFTSLSQAAEENGMSRIYGGVHWMQDHKEAMRCGIAIADNAFHNMFPVRG